MGKATVALPGGCTIGARPVDFHIKGFEAMGAKIDVHNGYADATVPSGKLHGASIYLDMPSVGATQNLMMAASLAKGRSVIENAAKEPEVVDLAIFLNKMGANIRGAGTDMIRITGVDKLVGTNHTVIPDRIQAGTIMIAAAAVGGNVYLEGAISDHLKALIAKLQEAGVRIEDDVNGIRVISGGSAYLKPVDVKTQVHPGFPTDLQAPIMALLTKVPGSSLMTETVFENRFMQVPELQRMGSEIRIEGRSALIDGVPSLTGAKVTASDLRAGAALVIAGMMAGGTTEVHGLLHIDRGYAELDETLRKLGADIRRVT
ncbi:MAG: UDP-N-acetylglucosamine 1-carboxyvinyltransferase [Bacilli bacterium]|nr:UDP-N-acetylglucosamine 1-carboxyvinyltransferase [Bacilli bacterium]